MKPEIYSCIKMLESLYDKTINTLNINGFSASKGLGLEYIRIRDLLKKYLTEQQFEFVPYLETADFSGYAQESYLREAQRGHLITTATLCEVTISFLKSLDMDLDKELAKQKVEFELKEKELKIKEKENEHMQKLLNKSLEAIKEFPEFQRSKFVEETKKSHREIQRNTDPNTRSQNN